MCSCGWGWPLVSSIRCRSRENVPAHGSSQPVSTHLLWLCRPFGVRSPDVPGLPRLGVVSPGECRWRRGGSAAWWSRRFGGESWPTPFSASTRLGHCRSSPLWSWVARRADRADALLCRRATMPSVDAPLRQASMCFARRRCGASRRCSAQRRCADLQMRCCSAKCSSVEVLLRRAPMRCGEKHACAGFNVQLRRASMR